MLRIVGIQRNESAQREFVLLQNQGNLRIQLRGHMLMSEMAVDSSSNSRHVFADDAQIPAGMYVMLVSGIGEARWAKTKEGAMVYYTYMNRTSPVWEDPTSPIHVLAIQHSYSERPVGQLLHL